MIDIPLGKALVPVEADDESDCDGCIYGNDNCNGMIFHCYAGNRKDGKNVIFKLVDWPKEKEE
jgi:hypothetical protein